VSPRRLFAPAALAIALSIALPSLAATPVDRAVSIPAAIHAVQGDGLVSPLAGSSVTTEGVVTARTVDGYFIQTPDGSGDGLPGTSQGLFVHIDGGPGAAAAVGNLVRVTGTVEEYRPSSLPHQLPLTRLTAVSAELVLATSQPLPAPVVPEPAELAPGGDVAALERLEGMRVHLPELVVVGAADALIDPVALTAQTDGVFHVVAGLSVWGEALPFRQPGLSVLDAGTPPPGKNLPLHEGNPQVLRVDSGAQPGAARLDLGLNDRLRDAVGVLGYGGARYSLLLDPVSPLVVDPGSRGEGAAFSGTGEVKLVWMDLGELFDASDDPAIAEPVPSPSAYQARLEKLATHLCTFMLNPEIIAVGGVENVSVLEDLAALIETNPSTYCPEPRQYQAVLVESGAPDGLDVGFLLAGQVVDGVHPRVEVLQSTTLAAGETSAHPAGGAEPLFTQRPLLVQLQVTDEAGRRQSLTALNVRMRALADADSLAAGSNGWATVGEQVMTLRARQAAYLAGWLESRQQADPDEPIAVLGGFDADAFNDGRVDVMGIITGQPAPQDQAWVWLPSPVTTPLTNLTTTAPAYARYNANDRGEFRALDHIVVNAALLRAFAVTTASPRMNADFPASRRVAGGDSFTFSARDPLMARLAVANFIDADTRVDVYTNAAASPRRDNTFYVSVANQGPSAAPSLQLVLDSTLAPAQWSLSTTWPGWTCGDIAAEAGGSRVTCTNDQLLSSDGHGFEIAVPADLSLDGQTVTFSASLTGGHNDPDLSNNSSTGSVTFDGRVDLKVGLLPLNSDQKVLPSESSGWVVIVERSALNPPGPVTIRIDIDAAADEVTFNLGDNGLTCDAGVATGARRSRFTCSVLNDDFLQVAVFGATFATGLGDGGRVIGISVEASSGSPDATPADNTASDSRRVSDDVDLVATASASHEEASLDSLVSVLMGVRNDVTGVARNARVEIQVDLPPDQIGAVEPATYDQTPNVWTCAAPVAQGAGSRIACVAPPLLEQPAFRPRNYYFTLRFTPAYRPGLASYPVNVAIAASSDSDELVPGDNAAQVGFTVDQTSDFAARASTPAGPVVEPGVATFPLQFDSLGVNTPRNPRARLVFNAVLPPGDLTITNVFGQAVDCEAASGPAGTTTRICPVWMQEPWLDAKVRTNPDLAFTTLTIESTAINDLVDVVPGNDTATASVQVIARADMCLGTSCSFMPTPYPFKLEPDLANTLAFDLANLGPSTARTAEVIVQATLAPARLTASFNGQACTGAQDIGGGRSELRCALGDLPGNGVRRQLLVGLDTAGQVSGDVDLGLSVQSGVPDPNLANNARSFLLPIIPLVDLSADVSVKRTAFPAPAQFSVRVGAEGPATTALSELVVRVESPGASEFPDLRVDGPGWLCSPESYDPALQQWICSRFLPIAPGAPERIVVEVPASSFMQIGRTVSVTATHRYPPEALATDRTPANNSATGTHVVDGRRTQSVKPKSKPTPAYGGGARPAAAPERARKR
jgi:hypothetical protein